MANIKNFGLVGVGSGVQFGKGGSQLIQTSGTFAAKNAAGTAFVRFQIADGAGSDDAITFNQLTNAVALVDSNAAAIQSELDATQLGAGLNPDGSYTPGTSNYLAGANSLANAAILLDAALFAETTARTAADLALADAVANATANTGLIQAELDTVEASVGLGTDGLLTIGGNYVDGAASLVAAVEILDTEVFELNANAGLLDGRVDDVEANVALLQNSVATINSDIDDLTTRVGLVESNTIALSGLVTGLRQDVDANSALLLDTIADLAVTNADVANTNANAVILEGRVTNVEDGLVAETNARVAADATLTSNLAAEVAARTQADSDLSNSIIAANTALVALSANAVLKDGTVAMTGDLDLGNHNIVNLADPTTPFEAATKNYVDASIGTLSGAFLYQGTVTPGADIGNATVMNAVAEPGWYYKATGDGYLIGADVGAVAFQVFANDGVVKNNSGDPAASWDVLGAVQFQIGAGDSSITVNGSVDTGYQVSVSDAYTATATAYVDTETAARTLADGVLQSNIDTETAARIQGDSDLSNAIANTGVAVSDEANARIAADTIHTSDIANTNANAVLLTARVTQAESDILAEANARTNADAALSTRIDTNANAISGLDARVTVLEAEAGDSNAAILAETAARIAADLDLQANIDTVTSDLADFELDTANSFADVSNSIAATNANVANAQAEIDAVEAGAGLGAGGAYTANAGSNYLANATSLFDADNLLDTAVADLATELATLSQDTIKTVDGLNSVHVTDQSVVTSLNVTGVATPVVTVLASDTTDSNLVMDLTNAGEVKLAAMGSGADVDLRLTAQGAGHVIVGETGVGVIQAEDGYSLTVAGGTGAPLNLIGSSVNIQSDNGSNVAVFSAAANATAFATVVAATTHVAFATDGAAADIDLVLSPKGAGTVDVSMARVVNVANATSANDAVNLAQLTDAISSADVGMVKTLVAILPGTDGTVTLGTITGTVLSSRVLINNAYAPGTAITVGSSGGNDIAAATDVDETAAGIYITETASDYVGATITATVLGATGTGAAKVIVEYLTA